MWDLGSYHCKHILKGHTQEVLCLCIAGRPSNGEHRLTSRSRVLFVVVPVVGGCRRRCLCCDGGGGGGGGDTALTPRGVPSAAEYSVDFAMDSVQAWSTMLCSGSADTTVHLWSTRTYCLMHVRYVTRAVVRYGLSMMCHCAALDGHVSGFEGTLGHRPNPLCPRLQAVFGVE